MSSNALCKACTLLEGLERGMADAGIVSPMLSFPCRVFIYVIQTDKGRRRLDAEGPPPDNIRRIPYFKPPSGKPAISVESPP